MLDQMQQGPHARVSSLDWLIDKFLDRIEGLSSRLIVPVTADNYRHAETEAGLKQFGAQSRTSPAPL